jgi:hypothetical protein
MTARRQLQGFREAIRNPLLWLDVLFSQPRPNSMRNVNITKYDTSVMLISDEYFTILI